MDLSVSLSHYPDSDLGGRDVEVRGRLRQKSPERNCLPKGGVPTEFKDSRAGVPSVKYVTTRFGVEEGGSFLNEITSEVGD